MIYLFHLLTLISSAITLFVGYKALTAKKVSSAISAVFGLAAVAAAALLMINADKQRQYGDALAAVNLTYGNVMSSNLGSSIPPKSAERIKSSLIIWAGSQDSQCTEIPSVISAAVLAENVPAAIPQVLAAEFTSNLATLCHAMSKVKALVVSSPT